MKIIFVLAAAYLAGSVNFSICLFWLLGRDDPRLCFSGNAGVTNVRRQAGLFWAAVVLLLDIARALAVAIMAVHSLELGMVPWAGLALVIGNRFPCFHQFQGGKGVAGYLGFTVITAPFAAALSCLVWVAVYAVVRVPFVASFFMIACLAGGTVIAFGYKAIATMGAMVTVLFIVYNHRKNISDLLRRQA